MSGTRSRCPRRNTFWSLGEADLLGALDRLVALEHRVASVRLRVVHEVDSRGAATSAGAPSTAAYLRARLRMRPSSVGAEVRNAGEAFLLDQAHEHDLATLAKLGRHLLHVVDPDAGDRLTEDEGDAVLMRELFLTPDRFRPGTVLLRGRLDAETAAALRTALDPLSAPRPSGEEGHDLRTPARRAADACDARVVPVVLGGPGESLDVGRASSVVPPGMRRALGARDRGCACPGCDRPAQWCDAHHVRHWPDGGDTALSNLVLLRGHHHRVLHHDG